MPKKILITFGGIGFDTTVRHTVEKAPKLGADQVLVYDDRWLAEHPFHSLNKWLWTYPDDQKAPSPRSARGFGWFSWKPMILLHALSQCQDGDIVGFLDADTYPIADFSCLYDICARDSGIMLFAAQGQGHEKWCKRDCFIVMGQDEPAYRFVQAGVARFCFFQKGPFLPQQFLREWYAYCLNRLAQSFEPSVLAPEYPELVQHRTEQAIMTNLAHKYNLHLYREACGFGDGALADGIDAGLYPTLFRQMWAPGPHGMDDLSGSWYRNVAPVVMR